MNEYLDLFLSFAKVGVLTFGGGIAMIPMMTREICEKKKWADENELMDYYAIGQVTPGIIAVNVSTFIGKKRKGNLGGVAATLGMVFPSLLIIMAIAAFIGNFRDMEWVQHAFAGIRLSVCALILNAMFKLAKKSLIDITSFVIYLAVFIPALLLNISPVIYVVLAAIAGIILQVKKS